MTEELKPNYIYAGIPAKKFKKNFFFEDKLQDKIMEVKDIEKLREQYENRYEKRYDKKYSKKER
jgi:hypothetical protein